MGDFDEQVHSGEVWLKRGYYPVRHGLYKFKGPGIIFHGQGQESTVIKGDIEIHGEGYIFENVMIDGNLEIHGNNNTFHNVDVKGSYHDKGMNNRHYQ
jgi:hypothetical protein